MSASLRLVKRSVSIAGHRTSVSLEDAFWDELRVIAAERAMPVAALIAAIDGVRDGANLSSAIRVFVLGAVRSGMAPTPPPGA